MSSHETYKDLGSASSSEEDSIVTDCAAEEEKEKVASSPAALRHHPFSVEAIMSGKVLSSSRNVHSSHKEPPRTPLNPLYPRESSRKGFIDASSSSPTSPVKSETSEPEECAPWVSSNAAFPTQPRTFFFSIINSIA